MDNHQTHATITGSIVCMFIFLFAYTAVSKLLDLDAFELTLHQSALIGNNAGLVSWLVPVTELSVVLLLLLKNTRKAGFYCATVVMFFFTFYVFYMLLTEPKLPCSCGGIIGAMSWKAHLAFNGVFSCLGIFQIVNVNRSGHNNYIVTKQDKLFIAQQTGVAENLK